MRAIKNARAIVSLAELERDVRAPAPDEFGFREFQELVAEAFAPGGWQQE